MASVVDGGADAGEFGSCSGLADAGDDDSAVSFAELPAPVSDFVISGEDKAERREIDASELEMMKERFAKLLLGEDMSGGSKGVSTALAIANAITNLSATIFGALWRLEPLAPQKKSMWRREMECLLCVTDYIVDLVPSQQAFPGGGTFDVMVPRPRSDLYMNLPALKKLDAMLIGVLDSFKETEFSYVDRGILLADSEETGSFPLSSSQGQPSTRQEDKWWLPCPHVPPNGLSDEARKRLQQRRDCVNQIMKAAIAINSSVLAEMEIPDGYYRSLHKKIDRRELGYKHKRTLSRFIFLEAYVGNPTCGKACLGDTIYHYISAEKFSPECILGCLDISSEYQALEIANRIEGAINLWNQKFYKNHPNRKKTQKPSWTGKVKGLVGDAEKSHKVMHRAECLLQSLKIRYPALPQSLLDMTKIQYNKDVGQSILESYSRVMESLAFNIMARIDDVIYVDDAIRDCAAEPVSVFTRGGFGGLPLQKKMPPSPFSIQNSSYSPPFASSEFSSSSAVASPKKPQLLDKGKLLVQKNEKMEKQVSTDKERVWSYAESLTTGRDTGVTPERH